MPAHFSPSPVLPPLKRTRLSPPENKEFPDPVGIASPSLDGVANGAGISNRRSSSAAAGSGGSGGQSSSFRNVSACNRCRLRKNKCDQRLPSCASCEKAKVGCVGYDPITKRQIPRSYVYYLETRAEQLESLLQAHHIAFPASENLEFCSRPGNESSTSRSPAEAVPPIQTESSETAASSEKGTVQNDGNEASGLQELVSKSNMPAVPDASIPRFLGVASGISFAKVVFAAVQMSVSDQRSTSEKNSNRPARPLASGAAAAAAAAAAGMGTSLRDSFGLHAKPTIHPAPFPDKSIAHKLVTLYFEHANPQMPVLHKVNFMHMFEQAYADQDRLRGPQELYMLNMVFAIGGGIIMDDGTRVKSEHGDCHYSKQAGSNECQPEQYHASAVVHFEACLNNSGSGLEELQAVLLLASFALLRPVPPGLWYIIGVAVRLAVDLGLHYEDGKDVEAGLGDWAMQQSGDQVRERGRREYIRDMRRRLWWCTYSFDRLVSVCVGRPFGISDQVITTEFPSLLDDRYITPTGLKTPSPEVLEPTYKLVAHHYFRLRLLQSEILQVLQYQQAQVARIHGQNLANPHMHTHLSCPFLFQYQTLRDWRIDIDKKLYDWKNSAPVREQTGVAFSTIFLDLNYWQAIIMLYRPSLSVPAMFEGEYNTSKAANSPTALHAELRVDEDRVYLKVAEAGQKILRLYRQLHLVGLVNYTYLATHHLFMAGISYLYAIWHSPIVRSRLVSEEVDFTILAATSVFTDLIEKCPPAEACRDAFERTAKATIKMANSTGGFGVTPAKSRTGIASQTSAQRQQSPSLKGVARPSFDSAAYSNSGSSATMPPAQQQQPQYRLSVAVPSIKSDAGADGFCLMRNLPTAPRSAASSRSEAPGMDPDAALDPALMSSPTMINTVIKSTPPQQQPLGGSPSLSDYLAAQRQQQPHQQQNTLSAANLFTLETFGDLQGIDLGDFGNGNAAAHMDLGLGLGWEGMHHDFSGGQQVDLFDGFFFGGQQVGGGMGGGI